MPTLAEITNAAQYKGDAALGGFGGAAYNIDTRPIQQLAQYTFLYNKSQYDQRQKDADQKIQQLAKLTAYDLTTGIPKDKDELLDAQAKLIQYRAEEAAKGTPSNPKEKMQREVDFLSRTAELIKKIDAAGARKIKLDAYKNATQIDATLSTEQKELKIKQAEQLFNDTDIYTLPTIPEHNLTIPTVGETVYDKIQTFKEDASGNLVIGETIDEYSYTGNAKMGYLEGNDLMFPPTLPANATPQQKAEYEQKKLAFSKSRMGGWKDAQQFFAGAFNDPNYKKTVTTTDINVIGSPSSTSLTDEIDVEKVVASNPILGGTIQLGEAYNNAIKSKIARLEKQQYESSLSGKNPLFTQGTDTPESLKKLLIDVTKPLSTENLAALARFEKARPDKVEMKLIETGLADKAAIIAETKRNNTLDYKVAKQNADTAYYNAHKGITPKTGETQIFMDLTGYKGTLSIADMAAINPDFVTSDGGILKYTPEGKVAKNSIKILANGDVVYNEITKQKDAKGKMVDVATPITVSKGAYQGQAITLTQTFLKDRKDETQNPFTFTGLTPQSDNKPQLTPEQKAFNLKYFGNENGKQ